MDEQLWTYGSDLREATNLEGFDVEATDGSIGSIDEATFDIGASFIVVDTGPWIFGKRVLIPAGAIEKIDLEDRDVFLRLTKDQVKGSPTLDEGDYTSPDYRDLIGAYYGPLY